MYSYFRDLSDKQFQERLAQLNDAAARLAEDNIPRNSATGSPRRRFW